MSTAEQLITHIKDLSASKYIKKDTKDFIKENMELIKECATDQENKHINTIINVINNPNINKSDRDKIKIIKAPIINIIKKYEEEFNDEENEDDIDENLTIDEIENKLDAKVPNYNKFDENHPMKGVTWSKSKNKYQIKYDKIDTVSKNLDTACQKIISNYDLKKSEILGNNSVINHFVYKKHYFICYWKDNKPYFDIQHVISVLNLKKSSWNEKYNEFSNNIYYYKWHKNDFDGYILRELIDEETTYQILFSSNSTLSKSFKKDISKILADLRKNNAIELTNNKIKLKKNNAMTNTNFDVCKKISKSFRPYSYKNIEDRAYVQSLITCGANFSIAKYINCHILYAFIIPIKTEHDDIIIKFGYSEDLVERITSLQSEFKCKIFFIKAKIISGKKNERQFHDMLKAKYSDLIQDYSIKGKDKTELYKLHPVLMNEFDNYLNDNEPDDLEEDLDDEQTKLVSYIKKQEALFLEYTCENDYPMSNDLRYKYLIIKEKNQHARIMKDKEITLSESNYKHDQLKYKLNQQRYANIDKEIQLAKFDIEKIKAQAKYEKITKCNNYTYDSESDNDSDENTIKRPIKKTTKRKQDIIEI